MRTGSHQAWGLAFETLALQGPCAPKEGSEWAPFGGQTSLHFASIALLIDLPVTCAGDSALSHLCSFAEIFTNQDSAGWVFFGGALLNPTLQVPRPPPMSTSHRAGWLWEVAPAGVALGAWAPENVPWVLGLVPAPGRCPGPGGQVCGGQGGSGDWERWGGVWRGGEELCPRRVAGRGSPGPGLPGADAGGELPAGAADVSLAAASAWPATASRLLFPLLPRAQPTASLSPRWMKM